MAKRTGRVHVAITRRHYKGKTYEAVLLRRSYREARQGPAREPRQPLHLPEIIDAIRAMLAGRRLVDLDEDFEIERSLPHGHVAAVLGVLRALDLDRLIGRERSRERDLVVAMICQRLIGPGSKLSATRRFAQTTLAEELDLGEVKEAELLAAMDWLLERQQRIEQHARTPPPGRRGLRALRPVLQLRRGALLPAGHAGLLARRRQGKPQINYGLTCSPDGPPGRDRGARRQHAGPVDAAGAVDGRPRALRDRGRGLGRRPRMITTGARRRRSKTHGIDFVSALKTRPDPGAARRRRAAAVAV